MLKSLRCPSAGFPRRMRSLRSLRRGGAARLAYLGLYALQHRGQESAGIATPGRGRGRISSGRWATSPTSSTRSVLARLPGRTAIGHVRYSTAGGSLLVQRAADRVRDGSGAAGASPTTAISSTPREIRAALESSRGRSSHDLRLRGDPPPDAPGRRRRSSGRLHRGALRGPGRLLAPAPRARASSRPAIPHGIRPLVLGVLEGSPCVASETCAFDLLEARSSSGSVEPGEIVGLDGRAFTVATAVAFPPADAAASSSTSTSPGRTSVVFGDVAATREAAWARGSPASIPPRRTSCIPVPDSRHVRGARVLPARRASRSRWDSSATTTWGGRSSSPSSRSAISA